MISRLSKLVRDRRGATAIEYGLIVALIVIGALAGIVALGSATSGLWSNVQNRVSDTSPD